MIIGEAKRIIRIDEAAIEQCFNDAMRAEYGLFQQFNDLLITSVEQKADIAPAE